MDTPSFDHLEKPLRKFQLLNRQKTKLECQLKCVKIDIRQLIDYHIHSPNIVDLRKAIKIFKKKNQELRKKLVHDFTNIHLDNKPDKTNISRKSLKNQNGETHI